MQKCKNWYEGCAGAGRVAVWIVVALVVLVALIAVIGYPPLLSKQELRQALREQDMVLVATGVWDGTEGRQHIVKCENFRKRPTLMFLAARDESGAEIIQFPFTVVPSGDEVLDFKKLSESAMDGSSGTFAIYRRKTKKKQGLVGCESEVSWEGTAGSAEALQLVKSSVVVPAQSPPLRGVSYNVYNSKDTEDSSEVSNKLLIYNPGTHPFDAEVVSIDGKGDRASESFPVVGLKPGAQITFKLDGVPGEQFALYKVIPAKEKQVYGSYIERAQKVDEEQPMMFPGRSASCDSGFLPFSVEEPGSDVAELANLARRPVKVLTEVFNSEGSRIASAVEPQKAHARTLLKFQKDLEGQAQGFFRVRCADRKKDKEKLVIQTVVSSFRDERKDISLFGA